jgi:hypothetical protein
VEVVMAMDHPLVQRFDIAPEDVTLAWIVQTRTDVVALLEQIAAKTAEVERLKRASSITNFQAFLGIDGRIHVHVESDAGAVGDFIISDSLMRAVRESVAAS